MPEPRLFEPLYDAVAWGMWAYTRSLFRVEDLVGERFRPGLGTMLVSSHRAETDVPLLCPALYREGRYLRDRGAARVHFAARDDMFERGFFAGFPSGLPLPLRRLLYPLEAGWCLPRVRVHPVPYPSVAQLRLGRALEGLPAGTPLEPLLPAELLGAFEERARDARARPPRTAGEALKGLFADLLWRFHSQDELRHPAFEEAWRRRADEGAQALRRLVELIRSGEMLLLFPEGRPSPDGTIGPIRKGLRTLVRRGRPRRIVPIAIAYDPLTPGRTRAYVAFGEAIAPPSDGLEDAVLRALRLTTPLTCGQVVARELLRAASAGDAWVETASLDRALAAAVGEARGEGRPVERALLDAVERRRRLTEALTRVTRSGLASAAGSRRLVPAAVGVLESSPLPRLARELASARDLAPHASL